MPESKSEIKREIDAYWRQSATRFDAHYESGYLTRLFLRRRTQIIEQWLPTGSKYRIADVGCGSGVLMVKVADRIGQVVGFDYSRQMLSACEERLRRAQCRNWRLACCSAYDLDAPNDYFDCVVSLGLLDYLERPLQALQEFTRVMRSGGIGIWTAPKTPSLLSPLRRGIGLYVRRRFLGLPPILTSMTKEDVKKAARVSGQRITEMRSLWTTMWIVRVQKPS